MDRILVQVTDGTSGGAVSLRAQTLSEFIGYLKNTSSIPNISRTSEYLELSNNSGTSYRYYFADSGVISC